jgi:hypothetical protein
MTERFYHEDLLDEFGDDLERIFGPVEDRTKGLTSLAGQPDGDLKAIIKNLKTKVIDCSGFMPKRQPFLNVVKEVLRVMRDSIDSETGKSVFYGYNLPYFIEEERVQGVEEFPWDRFYIDYNVQRNIDVAHIIQDILIEWDTKLCDPAHCRMQSDGTLDINDAQHATCSRALVGARLCPATYIKSDSKSDNANTFGARNIRSKQTEWFDNMKVRVYRSKEMIKDGFPPKAGDAPYLELHDELEEFGAFAIATVGTPKSAGSCNRAEKLYDYRGQYGADIFKRAVRTVRTAWGNGELDHATVWGICTLMWYCTNNENFGPSELRKLETELVYAIQAYYPDKTTTPNRSSGRGTLWGDLRKLIAKDYPKDLDDFRGRQESYPFMIASALRSMILNYDFYRTHPEGLNSKSQLKLDLPPLVRKNGTTTEYAINPVLIIDNRQWDRLDSDDFNQQEFDDGDYEFEDDETIAV